MDDLLKGLIGPFRLYAAAGLVLSLYAHVAALLGYALGDGALFSALHIGVFPLWIVVVAVSNRMIGKSGLRRSDFWKQALAGCPEWMQLMTKVFFVYALFNFALFVMFGPHGKSPAGETSPAMWRGFSGHWMLFYSIGLAVLTSARNIGVANLDRKCPNGHAVGWEAAFCPACGAALPKPPAPRA